MTSLCPEILVVKDGVVETFISIKKFPAFLIVMESHITQNAVWTYSLKPPRNVRRGNEFVFPEKEEKGKRTIKTIFGIAMED